MTTKRRLFALATAGLICNTWGTQATVELKTEQDKINYSVGHQVGADFKEQGIGLSQEALVKGVADVISGTKPLMAKEEMDHALMELKHKVVAHDEMRPSKMMQQYLAEGRAFLAENARKEGVITLPNGIQYKSLKPGNGKSPKAGDSVAINYAGSLIDGQTIGRSNQGGKPGPATYRLEAMIPGVREALKAMKEGDHWQIFIPSEMSYPRGSGPLELRAVIFDLELVTVNPPSSKL